MSDFDRDDSDGYEDWHDDETDFEDESTATITCAECGEQVFEDSPQCPSCGNYFTPGTAWHTDRPTWFIVLGLAGVVALILTLVLYRWD